MKTFVGARLTVLAVCVTMAAARATRLVSGGQEVSQGQDVSQEGQEVSQGGQEVSQHREKRDSFDMMNFLEHYGYLQAPRSRSGTVFHSEASVNQAVIDFQTFTGLPVTGRLDQRTVDKMRAPRCGFPDLPRGPTNTSGAVQADPHSFMTLGTRWGKDTVTWRASTMSRKMSEPEQWLALEKGFKHWADVTPLKFRRTNGDADIDIQFVRGDHGDGYHNRFNGVGGVLAHAFQPGEGIGGDTHFDEDEQWTVGTGEGADLHIVAAHEFGHALGLGHSNVYGALMAPYYQYSEDMKLHSDDVQGIQALYGSRLGPVTKPNPTTTTTTTTTTTPPPTTATTATTTTTTADPDLPSFCGPNFRADAMVGSEQEGTSYLFRHDKVYMVGPWGLVRGLPRYIPEVFPGAPRRHVAAAVHLPETSTHFLFKGARVWRYTNFRLDSGYPKMWLSYEDYYRFRPSAALTFTYWSTKTVTKIFMFGESTFWEWDARTEKVVPGYPLQTAVYWKGAPQNPEAAISNIDNNFYFFKGNRYFKLHNRVSVGESKPMGKDWFGLACGASYLQNNQPADFKDQNSHPGDNMQATSDISLDDIYREKVAPLPFEFDLGVADSDDDSERNSDGYYY